jgi:hypothetical protein
MLRPTATAADEHAAAATADALLAHLASFRKPSLQRTQSDTATNALQPQQALYKTAIAQHRHQRQLSTDSISSTHSDDARTSVVTGWETVDLSHKRIVDLPVEVIRALAGSVERREFPRVA